jgi:hypothetical protein
MYHAGFRQEFVAQQTEMLDRRVRRAADVTLRRSSGSDPSLARLAQLESRDLVAGPYAVAEVGGEVVAAVPLEGGPALGDPFQRTEHLLPLLRVWAHPRRPRLRWKAA